MAFITDYIQTTATGLLATGITAAGGMAGNAVGGVGALIEGGGRSIGNGIRRVDSSLQPKLTLSRCRGLLPQRWRLDQRIRRKVLRTLTQDHVKRLRLILTSQMDGRHRHPGRPRKKDHGNIAVGRLTFDSKHIQYAGQCKEAHHKCGRHRQ